MLKILQVRLQQYVNHELLDVQAGFRKGSGTQDQIGNIRWIIEKAREFQKNIYFCFIDYAKASDCVHHNKLWKILKEMGIPDHLTCRLRNLNAGQEATVRTGHGTTNSFLIGKGVHQGCILSPCFFNLYVEWKWKWSEVAQSCLTLCDPMDCSLSGFSVHGIFQARILEWVAISFSRDLPDPGIKPGSPALQADAFTLWATREAYVEYITQNARLDEAQAGIKIASRNINNLRYADDTNLWQKVKRN